MISPCQFVVQYNTKIFILINMFGKNVLEHSPSTDGGLPLRWGDWIHPPNFKISIHQWLGIPRNTAEAGLSMENVKSTMTAKEKLPFSTYFPHYGGKNGFGDGLDLSRVYQQVSHNDICFSWRFCLGDQLEKTTPPRTWRLNFICV